MTEVIDLDDDPAVLYRLYDASGGLLYVGISCDPLGRFSKHGREKPWWPDVARKTAALCASRTEALAAEEAAIRDECPLHNVQHQVYRPPVVAPAPAAPAASDASQTERLAYETRRAGHTLQLAYDEAASLRLQVTTLIRALTLTQRELRKEGCQHALVEDRCCVRCHEWVRQ